MEKNQIEGYGFHPTNEELTGHYLRKKRLNPDFSDRKITEIDIYEYEPSELPGLALFQLDAPIWYFFVALSFKYANSKRAHRRTTRGGTWKVTGKERDVKDRRTKEVIGSKRTLVFYNGRTTSKDARTNWVMHEYRCKPDPLFKGDEFVVVRIKKNPNNWFDSSTPNESVRSHHPTFDSGGSQLLPNPSLNSNIKDLVRKNTAPEPEVGVEPLVPAVGLDQDSFSTQQTQIHLQQQQQASSHSCGFSGVSNVSNSPLGSEQENNWINNSELTVQFQDDTADDPLKGGFSPMAYGEYDFSRIFCDGYGEYDFSTLFEPASCPAADENIVPV